VLELSSRCDRRAQSWVDLTHAASTSRVARISALPAGSDPHRDVLSPTEPSISPGQGLPGEEMEKEPHGGVGDRISIRILPFRVSWEMPIQAPMGYGPERRAWLEVRELARGLSGAGPADRERRRDALAQSGIRK